MSTTTTSTVGIIEECPDLFIDTCICDSSHNLVFMSAWGRDTATQELLARLTLASSSEHALRLFNLTWENKRIPVYPEAKSLDKRMARNYRGTLFGTLTHLWLFDEQVTAPDQPNHMAYVLLPGSPSEDERESKLWSQVVALTPFPLLDHWQDHVMQIVREHTMIEHMTTWLGDLQCWQINLKVDVLEQAVGSLIRSGHLTLP